MPLPPPQVLVFGDARLLRMKPDTRARIAAFWSGWCSLSIFPALESLPRVTPEYPSAEAALGADWSRIGLDFAHVLERPEFQDLTRQAELRVKGAS
jgi:hypothetical protein